MKRLRCDIHYAQLADLNNFVFLYKLLFKWNKVMPIPSFNGLNSKKTLKAQASK